MTVHLERQGPDDVVAVLTLDRPERRNALDHDTLGELIELLGQVKASAPRAVVLTGASGHFCAGADLSGVEDPAFTTYLQHVLDRIRRLPCPTIAAVEGAALGAGTQLAVACDLRVATPGATFGIPAAKLGLMVDHWTVQRVALLLGPSLARPVLLAAETLSGADAHRVGFVHRIGTPAEALDWAGRIAELAPLTIAGHKLMLDKLEQPVGDDPEVLAAFERAWTSDDFAEGIDAFRARRRPRFEGR